MTSGIGIPTSRLYIRNFESVDRLDLQEIAIDKEHSPYARFDYAIPTTAAGIQSVLEWFVQTPGCLAVCETQSQKVIGFVCLNGDKDCEKDLGYAIHSAFQRRGFTFEACQAILSDAFDMLGIESITSGTADLNYPSIKLLLKLGFRKINEEQVSFRFDAADNPDTFTGSSFELNKSDWLRKSARQ